MSLGPIPLTLPLAIACLIGLWIIARLYDARHPNEPSNTRQHLSDVALASLIGARVFYVGFHLDAYLQAPVSIFALGDGGFSWAGAVLGAIGLILFKTRQQPAARVPLAALSLTGLLLYWGGLQLLPQPKHQSLPDLTLSTLDGATVFLNNEGLAFETMNQSPVSSAIAARPLIINLWATWCGPCRREMPAFARAEQAFANVAFIMLNQGETSEEVKSYLAQKNLNFTYPLLDFDSALLHSLDAQALPTTLFINKQGEVIHTHMGELTYARLQDLIKRFYNITPSTH